MNDVGGIFDIIGYFSSFLLDNVLDFILVFIPYIVLDEDDRKSVEILVDQVLLNSHTHVEVGIFSAWRLKIKLSVTLFTPAFVHCLKDEAQRSIWGQIIEQSHLQQFAI